MAEYAVLLLVIATMSGIVGLGLTKHVTKTANTSTSIVDTQTNTAKSAAGNLVVP